MKIVTVLLLASALVATGQAAEKNTRAPILQELNGKVLVNMGDGLVSGKPNTALKDGDRVVTLDKSKATITFPEGCDVVLEENMIFVIDSQLGCKALLLPSNQAAAAAISTQGVFIGVAALVGAGALIVNNNTNNNNDKRPISNQ